MSSAPASPRAAANSPRADPESLPHPHGAERGFLGYSTRWWVTVFVIWTALALLSACQGALFLVHAGRPIEWRWSITGSLLDWYTCAAFTPAYIWLARRYPIDRRHWMIGVPVHLVATSLFVVLKYAAYGELRALVMPGRDMGLNALLARSFITETIAFWAMIGVIHALEFHRRVQERERQALRLQAQLAEARLESLTAQLHPHFLFNTLHGISTLMHRDVEAADTMLARLSDLLRRTLQNADRHEVLLREELDLLAHYVAIIGVRFQDRLTVETTVAPGVEEALVPHFILQPLVENAVQHGIARRAGAGRIEIRAEQAGDVLRLSVSDDGVGLQRNARAFPSEGIGLTNTRRRLAELYGRNQQLTLESAPNGGLRVTLSVPFRVEAGSPVGSRVAGRGLPGVGDVAVLTVTNTAADDDSVRLGETKDTSRVPA